jgi:hypothetical protein
MLAATPDIGQMATLEVEQVKNTSPVVDGQDILLGYQSWCIHRHVKDVLQKSKYFNIKRKQNKHPSPGADGVILQPESNNNDVVQPHFLLEMCTDFKFAWSGGKKEMISLLSRHFVLHLDECPNYISTHFPSALWSASEKNDSAVIDQVKKLCDKVREARICVALYDESGDDDDDLDDPRNLPEDESNLLDVEGIKFPPLMLGCAYYAKRFFCLYPQTDVLTFCGYSFISLRILDQLSDHVNTTPWEEDAIFTSSDCPTVLLHRSPSCSLRLFCILLVDDNFLVISFKARRVLVEVTWMSVQLEQGQISGMMCAKHSKMTHT